MTDIVEEPEFCISSSRVKQLLVSHGINSAIETKQNPIKQEIKDFKKEGMVKPVLPAKEAPEEEMTAYNAAMAEYKKYESPKFTVINEVAYPLYKFAEELKELLASSDEKPLTEKKQQRVAELQRYVSNPLARIEELLVKLNTKRDAATSEASTDKIAQRIERLQKLMETPEAFTKLVASIDTNSADSVGKLCTASMKAYPKMKQFIERDELTSQRKRSNSSAYTAAGVPGEIGIKQIIEGAIRSVVSRGKKQVNIEDCIASNDIRQLSAYPLFDGLPPLRRVYERAERRRQWETDKIRAEFDALKRSSKAKKVAGKAKAEVVEFESFGEREFSSGFADKTESTTDSGVKNSYSWLGIDDLEPKRSDDTPAENSVSYYINTICAKVHAELMDTDPEFAEKNKDTKISYKISFKKFLSALFIEYIRRLSSVANLIIKSRGNRTLTQKTIEEALRYIFANHCYGRTGDIELTDEQEAIFTKIGEQVEYRKQKKGQPKPKKPVKKPAKKADEVEAEAPVEVEEAPRAAPKLVKKAVKKAVKSAGPKKPPTEDAPKPAAKGSRVKKTTASE